MSSRTPPRRVRQTGLEGPRLTVAVIVPYITRWYFSTATAAVVDVLRAHGYEVLLYHLGDSAARDQFFVRLPLAGRVDGVVSLSMPLDEEHTLALRELGIPLVSIGSTIDGWPSVGIDEVGVARAATNHLLNLRHRQIGLIAGRTNGSDFDFLSSMGRRFGYEEALGAFGIELDGAMGCGRSPRDRRWRDNHGRADDQIAAADRRAR